MEEQSMGYRLVPDCNHAQESQNMSQVGRGLICSIVASSRLSDSGEDAKVKDTLASVEGAWK